MADREKVIKGLECCTADIPTDNNIHQDDFCKNCPYHKPEFCYCFAKVDLMRDALELLKAQDPRVMTLEEAIDAECVWLEFANKEEVVATMPYCNDAHDTDDIVIFLVPDSMSEYQIAIYPKEDGKYGSTWRCWTSRPTDEQRKATPWEPPKEG